ncbi:dual specificity protein phosphatase family protein [Calidifontibacter indicus]|uniref:dual specificity protein phosphatase family protein n=1 Tax=Calidifontibacter indicus TaxID=419650 RepID=UPI0014737EDB|nr:dual specificity protein phosphatase family protein [Calidifontibacter indicus]
MSLSRVCRADDRGNEKHVQAWLVDSDDPSSHNDLALGLHDAADALKELLWAGETVFLHCVHAHHRTPSVALLHAMKHGGLSRDEAVAAVRKALDQNNFDGLLWQTALKEGESA